MILDINYQSIEDIFKNAESDGRNILFENEVYEVLALTGSETPPKCLFHPKNIKTQAEELMALPGEKAVLKIVSPTIMHKTEVGGVRIVEKTPEKILSALRRIYVEVPEKYQNLIEKNPEHAPDCYKKLSGNELNEAIKNHIRGILQVQFMPPDSSSFGNELFVGLRRTREFGMVISAGLGGTDTELYAERFRKGQAIVAAPTAMLDGEAFFKIYKNTISYKKLAGLTRGQQRIVTDEQLIECFQSFIQMGNYFSPLNRESEFIIDELEVNPFAFTDFLMVPLDGLCKFSKQIPLEPKRPLEQIDKLLHPKSIGIVGVSSRRRNFGRIILENIIKAGYPKQDITIIKQGEDESGIKCAANIQEVEGTFDLLILAVDALQIPAFVDDIIKFNKANTVLLVPGGLGETEESKAMADAMIAQIQKAHNGPNSPVFLGANCLGVISRHGHYDTWFIPTEKMLSLEPYQGVKPRSLAVISQSGAFLLNRFNQVPEMNPAYLISMGNQTDLSLGDMMQYFEKSDKVSTIAVYVEGFKDLDGLAFVQSVQKARMAGKNVVFYKAGRTPEGKSATSGHTASLAGDYMVCESAISQAGGIVARTFTEFQDLVLLAESLAHKKINGKSIAAISSAGFEAVGMADSILSDEYNIKLGDFSEHTLVKMQAVLDEHKLAKLVQVTNPLDINPSANDEVHAKIAELALNDSNIDVVVLGIVPHSPVLCTADPCHSVNFDFNKEGSIFQRVVDLAKTSEKPLIVVVDGASQFDSFRKAIKDEGIPLFTLCDRAIAVLALYLEQVVKA